MNYRVGLPGWRLLGRMGVKLLVRVNVHFDKDTGTYWADSPNLRGLVVAAATLEELRQEAVMAASGLLDLDMTHHDKILISTLSARQRSIPTVGRGAGRDGRDGVSRCSACVIT